MRTFIVFILICLFISNSQPFAQLCKIPLLIQHYSKHKSADTSLSLFDFLKLHYSKESQNDNDDNEDNRLPFKNLVENSLSIYLLPAKDIAVSNLVNNNSSFNNRYLNGKPVRL